MNLKSVLFEQYSQLNYQFLSFPFAFLYYCLARQGCLSLTNRYIYLTSGGCILAAVSMGPYCWLLFTPAVVSALLVHSVDVSRVHRWVFGAQMCWQTLWHLFIQYKEYWLQEPTDCRLLLAMSALMLLTQRATSVSMDLQEGKLRPQLADVRSLAGSTSVLPYLSYTLYFPALLGGPLCSFRHFVSFVEQSSTRPPPLPLYAVCRKTCSVLGLEWLRYVLADAIERRSADVEELSGVRAVLWVLGLSLAFRLSYYSHWAASAALNNAAGLGFRGYGAPGVPLWDGLSDGDAWTLERSSRPSEFARRWNGTTAAWLRRTAYRRRGTAPLLMTFGFSAWWHGLHPGQVAGFLLWGAAVKADYRIHRRALPLLSTPARRRTYVCLSWAYTQLVIACVVVAVELRSTSVMRLLWRTNIYVFPLLYVTLPFFFYKNTAKHQ